MLRPVYSHACRNSGDVRVDRHDSINVVESIAIIHAANNKSIFVAKKKAIGIIVSLLTPQKYVYAIISTDRCNSVFLNIILKKKARSFLSLLGIGCFPLL